MSWLFEKLVGRPEAYAAETRDFASCLCFRVSPVRNPRFFFCLPPLSNFFSHHLHRPYPHHHFHPLSIVFIFHSLHEAEVAGILVKCCSTYAAHRPVFTHLWYVFSASSLRISQGLWRVASQVSSAFPEHKPWSLRVIGAYLNLSSVLRTRQCQRSFSPFFAANPCRRHALVFCYSASLACGFTGVLCFSHKPWSLHVGAYLARHR
jgi:hypothetical protein